MNLYIYIHIWTQEISNSKGIAFYMHVFWNKYGPIYMHSKCISFYMHVFWNKVCPNFKAAFCWTWLICQENRNETAMEQLWFWFYLLDLLLHYISRKQIIIKRVPTNVCTFYVEAAMNSVVSLGTCRRKICG